MIETGRRGDRWLERVVGKQPEKQTTRERKRLPASQGEADRESGRHHNRRKQVERQAETRKEDEKSRGQ